VPHRWDVYRVDFGQPIGHEPAKERPALIVSYEALNRNTPYVTVCPFTSTERATYALELEFPLTGGLTEPSILQVHLIRTIGDHRLRQHLGTIHDPVLRRNVETALARLLALPGGGA
jgi:mRNA interferase MazF